MIRQLAIAAALATAAPAALAQPAAAPNDAQIAHIAYTAGELDIAAAKQALDKSKSKDVRDFASQMVSDHTAVNQQALALVKKLNVTPEANPTSAALTKAAEAKRRELAGLSGAAFDKAYAQNELGYHQVVVKTVAEQWIPTIQNAEFKKFMTDANEIFKVHQAHAQHMVDGLK